MAISRQIGASAPDTLITSSASGQGIDDLKRVIEARCLEE